MPRVGLDVRRLIRTDHEVCPRSGDIPEHWDNGVIQLRPGSALRSGPAGSLGCEACGLSNLIGCHPKHEADDRMSPSLPMP
jgi:hypothetical protein